MSEISLNDPLYLAVKSSLNPTNEFPEYLVETAEMAQKTTHSSKIIHKNKTEVQFHDSDYKVQNESEDISQKSTFLSPISPNNGNNDGIFQNKSSMICAKCKKSFLDKESLQDHMGKVHRMPKKCPYCTNCFGSDDLLERHIRKHDIKKLEKSFQYECFICGQGFEKNEEFEGHLETHQFDEFFECPDCAELIDRFAVFKDHMIVHEANLNDFKIVSDDKCATQPSADNTTSTVEGNIPLITEIIPSIISNEPFFENLEFLAKDLPQEPPDLSEVNDLMELNGFSQIEQEINPLKCDESTLKPPENFASRATEPEMTKLCCEHCGDSFTDKRRLLKHLKTHISPTIKCQLCPKAFRNQRGLQLHLRTHLKQQQLELTSTTPSRFFCSKCGLDFPTMGELLKHESDHSLPKQYPCTICGKTFKHRASLNNHKVIHSGDMPFQCNHCGQSFNYSGNLKVHLRIHTGERPYSCPTCDKTFIRAANLSEHMKVHSGEKSYKCDQCNKFFANSSSHSKHLRIHSGEKRFQCQLCHKTFMQLAHLTKHIRVHTGEKPHACHLCEKKFSRSDSLKVHLKTHDKKIDQVVEAIEENCPVVVRQSNPSDRNINFIVGPLKIEVVNDDWFT